MRMGAAIDRLLPPELRRGLHSEARRARVAVGVLVFVAIASVVLGLVRVGRGYDAPLVLPTLLGIGALLWAFRRTKSIALLAHGVGLVLTLPTVGLVLLAGSVPSPAYFALGVIPLIVVFVGGVRAGLAWLSVAVASQVLAATLNAWHIELVTPVPGRTLPVLGGVALTAGTFVVGLAYERARARDEAEHEARREELRELLRAFPDLVVRLSTRGEILEVYTQPERSPLPPEPVGEQLTECFEERAELTEALATSGRVELELSHEDTTWNVRIEPFGRERLAFARDVTDEQEMEAKLVEARLHASLERADRMSSIGILAAGMAHEVNNPLAYLSGNLTYLSERLESDEEASSALRDAETAVERIRRIVADLKLHARDDSDESEEAVNLRDVVEAALNLARNELAHRAEVVVTHDDPPMVLGSERRLVQVLLNVLVNAAQALPPGAASEHRVAVKTGADFDGRAFLCVSDTGPGIPQEIIDKVTQPFFTTKPPGVGTGLGLSVCVGIVRQLGGSFLIESPPGQGAKITITLPAAPQQVAAKSAEMTAVRIEPRPGRILIIDDEPLVRRALRRLLREHDVVEAPSGSAGLEILADDERFDVILCDVMMPDVTGIDLYERLRDERPELGERLVFMTGGAFDGQVGDLMRAVVGETPVVQKPFQSEQLRRVLAERLGTA